MDLQRMWTMFDLDLVCLLMISLNLQPNQPTDRWNGWGKKIQNECS